jgi:hypothetical protein
MSDKEKNKIKTLVNHPMDHPDVIAVAKIKKEDREEFEEKYPKFSKLTGIAKGSDKEDKESAKRMVDYLQTIGAKKRTATEGSFAKGGRASFRGGGMCKKGMNKKARGANS